MAYYQTMNMKNFNKRILVLDDEPDIQQTMVELFETIGYTCDGASNGSEGIKLLSKYKYWLILSDIMMPVMSGPEFFRKIRNKYKFDHFIFLTGYDVPDAEIPTIQKADDLLSKPVALDKLLASLNKVSRTEISKK